MSRLIFFYSIFLFAFVVFSYLFVDTNFFYFKNFYTGFATSQRFITTFIYGSFILSFFIFYKLFLSSNQNLKLLVGLISVILLFSYSAMLSSDFFNYLTTAKVIFKYHENPYVVMPVEFIGDTNLIFTHAANKIALYGPLWILLTGIPYILSFGNFLLAFFNLKLVIALFYIGTAFLIEKLSKNSFSIALFILNPLVVIETLVSSHNDIVMMFFALLSFFLLKKKKILSAIMFLIFSIFIKYATLFLIPIFIITTLKTIRKEKIDWNDVYYKSAVSMFLIFLLSALRVEIYPWYAIWFLPFIFLVPQKRIFFYVSLAFSFGLLLRYIPFMLIGTHFGITPPVKTIVTFAPPALVIVYEYLKKIYR